jgi:hypothetical protein
MYKIPTQVLTIIFLSHLILNMYIVHYIYRFWIICIFVFSQLETQLNSGYDLTVQLLFEALFFSIHKYRCSHSTATNSNNNADPHTFLIKNSKCTLTTTYILSRCKLYLPLQCSSLYLYLVPNTFRSEECPTNPNSHNHTFSR